MAGSRVRFSTANDGDASRVAIVSAVRGDSLVLLRDGSAESITVPFDQMTQLDVSSGRRDRMGAGLGVGLVAGAAIGGLLGAATYQKPSCNSGDFFCGLGDVGAGGSAAGGAILGGVGGALVGLLIGSIVHTERWDAVPLPALVRHSHADLTLLPAGRGARLTVRLPASL
jgi:hypothetical protein